MTKKVTDSISSYRLFEGITNLSTSSIWEEAKKEWRLDHVEMAEDHEVAENKYVCLCGHPHLKELCFIINDFNGNETMVGNHCVKNFMGNIKSDPLFQAIRQKKLNKALIDYAREHRMITDREYSFLLDVFRKRKRSSKQSAWYESLKGKILLTVGGKI